MLDSTHYNRDVMMASLLAEGLPVGVHFPHVISDHPFIKQHIINITELFPGAECFARNHLVFPIYPALHREHMRVFVGAVKKVIETMPSHSEQLLKLSSEFLSRREIATLSSGLFLFLRATPQ